MVTTMRWNFRNRARHGFRVIGVLLLVSAGASLADSPKKVDTGSSQGYSLLWGAGSSHQFSHLLPTNEGFDAAACIIMSGPEGEDLTSGGMTWWDKQLKISFTTPLAGEMCNVAKPYFYQDPPPGTYYQWYHSPVVAVEQEWQGGPLMPAKGHLVVNLGSAVAIDEQVRVVHEHDPSIVLIPFDVIETVENWPQTVPAIQHDFCTGGEVSVVANENDEPEVEFDSNGRIVWVTPQDTILRLTSGVQHNSGSSVTYSYRVDNYTSEERGFSFQDIRTGSFPTGWYGVVGANSYATISNTVNNPPQDICIQTTQGKSWPSADSTEVTGKRVTVYIPANRAGFLGGTNIQSAAYSSGLQANAVTFRVTAQALEAHMFRTNSGTGTTELVGSMYSTLIPATDYTFTDPAPPSGTNEYYVIAGVRTNAGISGVEEIENQ